MSEKQFEEHLCQKCGSDIFQTIENHIACSSCGLVRGYIVKESDVKRVHSKEWEWDNKPAEITHLVLTEDKSTGYILEDDEIDIEDVTPLHEFGIIL